jgi:hypothetical protein
MKALWWNQNGYCLLYKRAHRSVFELPSKNGPNAVSIRIDGKALAQLPAGMPKVRSRVQSAWHRARDLA